MEQEKTTNWDFPFTEKQYDAAEKQRIELKKRWEAQDEIEIIRERIQKILLSDSENMLDEIIYSLYDIAIHKRKEDRFLLNSFSRFFGEGEQDA